MGVRVAAMPRDEALRHIDEALSEDNVLTVTFANANLLNIARSDPVLRHALQDSLVLNDGLALDVASLIIHGRKFPDNLNGTDFTPSFLAGTSHQLRVFILGGAPGVAETSLRKLTHAYPRHAFVGAHSGFFEEEDTADIVRLIRNSHANTLFVGMGNPKQEWWLLRHLGETGCKVGFAIGAFVDFSAGNIVRAPKIFRLLRIEWLFRLMLEPRRLLKRYTVDTAQFLGGALRERRRKIRSPHRR
jgi:exopolysaccharide biosynthesis WecB/TagA/CpsF family protein